MAFLTVSFIVHGDYSHIETALDSLFAQTQILCDVYVTINTGEAPQVDHLRQRYPTVRFLINERSRGFASNHNAVLRLAQTPYVALLNDDVHVLPHTFDVLVDYLDAHPDVGLVGPLVENPDGSPQLSSFSDPTLLRMIYRISGLSQITRHGGPVRRMAQRIGLAQRLSVESLNTDMRTREVPVIVGVSMVVRREAYLQAGMMDEDTLVYGEEIGWHWRLRQHGWKVALVTEARIIHYNPQSDLMDWKLAEHRKSILNYFIRYRSRWQALAIRAAIIGFHTFYTAVYWPFNRRLAADNWRAAQIGLAWGISTHG